MIFEFKGFIPVVPPSSYVHPQATVIGHVVIGKNVYIGPGAVLRGDWGAIEIADGCNVQENCVLHMFPGKKVILEQDAHIGHGAIIHGAHIGQNVMIGMNTVVMDDVVIERDCIIGALSFIKADMHIPAASLVVGNPGKIIKTLSEDMISWKSKGTALYQTLPADMHAYAREVAPLTEVPTERPSQEVLFERWKEISK